MRIYIYLIVILFCTTSCDKDELYSTFLDAGQYFFVLDKEGNDLLNPNNPNAITINDINVYYLIDGKKVNSFDYLKELKPNVELDDPKGISIDEPSGERERYILGIHFGIYKNETGSIATTYVEWTENDVDTIRSRVTVYDNYYESSMISFNDSVWSRTQDDPIFTIVR